MTARTARRRPRPSVPEFHPGQVLDWTDSRHWAYDGPHLCRYCKRSTYLLDDDRYPAHKVCAEAELARRYADAITEYTRGQL